MKLSSLIGLHKEKQRAGTQIKACLHSGRIFPHTLLTGVGGCGKTAFARSIGEELKYHFVEVHAASYKKRKQFLDALKEYSDQAQSRERPLLFFIDEIHRLTLTLQEGLYSPMKEWWIPTLEGQLHIPKFTLIGATTRFDMLDSNSFVTRFGNRWEIQRYPLQDMMEIVAYELAKQKFGFSADVVKEIAQRCLGIPRNAISLVEKVIFTALAEGRRTVTHFDVLCTFELEEIDYLGLNPIHHRYLQILSESCQGGKFQPLGVGSISAKMRQPEDVIKGSVEPVLLELSMISPSPRGRTLTDKGWNFLQKVQEFQKVA